MESEFEFSKYADSMNVRCMPHESKSFVESNARIYEVIFIPSSLPVPRDLHSQDF